MSTEFGVVKCGQCGTKLNESPSASPDKRTPCPQCGSLQRSFAVSISETIETHSKLSSVGRRPGMKRPFVEQISGDDLHRKSGRWMILNRVIDRLNNWYHEIVKDKKTGKIVHETSEPLTEHRGHGSAKKEENAG